MIPGLENILEKGQNSNDSPALQRLSYGTKCYQEELARQEAQRWAVLRSHFVDSPHWRE